MTCAGSLAASTGAPMIAPRRAIGVPEIVAMLSGERSRDDALAAAQLATRRYAKRQYTWFRHQPPAGWTRKESFSESDFEEIICLLG